MSSGWGQRGSHEAPSKMLGEAPQMGLGSARGRGDRLPAGDGHRIPDRYGNVLWHGHMNVGNGGRDGGHDGGRNGGHRERRRENRHGDGHRRRSSHGTRAPRDGRQHNRRQESRRRSRSRTRSGSRKRGSPRGDDRNGGHGRREARHSPGGRNGGRGGGAGTAAGTRWKAKGRSARSSSPRGGASSEYSSSTGSSGGRSSSKKGGKKKSADSDKDEIVHFSWQRGLMLNSRYQSLRLLGDGTFGRVLLARDKRDNRQVAVKVIRDVKRYVENARIEADILKDIRRADPMGEGSRSAIMRDAFLHQRHFCLVLDLMGPSLYDFLKRNAFRGFWMQDIQSFARQSLEGLAFLHGRLQITHTDLKPENILLATMEAARPAEFPREASWQEARRSSRSRSPSVYMRPASSEIKLIDFGNATYDDQHHSSIINTRQYRGPEVILSLGWNERSDIWSLGCILMELYTGELLFGTHENLEHLALMERVLQPLPPPMLNQAPRGVRDKYVKEDSHTGRLRLNWPEGASSSSSDRHVRTQRSIDDLAGDHQHSSFAHFVGQLLTADPSKRPSAAEALKNPFFSQHFED
mmetsp:Transcript_56793/g.122783  ORF Transcript_56793/g.122783 Transcript_56793/m.122783 type:complete len:579 (+) Transcript_56793:38-1774(+)